MNIILCGMPKSGKTTIGKKLAKNLGWDFIDTDQLIVNAYGGSCRELFQAHGELKFREMEKEQIKTLNVERTVISLGGGALAENATHLQSLGLVVYLKVPLKILWSRNCLKGIPAFATSEETFKELEEKRSPIYEKYAELHIDAYQLSTKEVIKIIWEAIHSERYLKSPLGENLTGLQSASF